MVDQTAGSLAGKTALVTGAGRGIGRAIAIEIAARGALVGLHYGHAREGAEAAVAAIEAAGGRAFTLSADLARVTEVPGLFRALDAALIERTGSSRLDILVNNAGVGAATPLEEATEEAFDWMFDINVKAVFFAIKEASSRLPEGGRVIIVSSNTAHGAYGSLPVYSATKAAVNSFARTLAQHFGPRGITVNALMPGLTETDMTAGYLADPVARAAFVKITALGRPGQPPDIAKVAAFLASPDAAWITGEALEASGGMRSGGL